MNWKDIPGYERIYEISDTGKIRSLAKRIIMRPRKAKDGSYLVNLTRDGEKTTFIVHRLVASLFVDNPEGKRYVKHKNGNKAHNAAENLYWTHAKKKLKEKVSV